MNFKNNEKVIRSWAFFDWANSAYSLLITSTVFPAYYTSVTSDNNSHTIDYVKFMSFKFINSALYNYALAFAFLVIAILSPVLSSIADTTGNRKFFMKIFTYMGGLACCGLYFFKLQTLQSGVVLFVIAAIGFWGSLVFYNAYLPEIATPDQQDRVSAKGFVYGYAGSILLQLICFCFLFSPASFGLSDTAQAARLSFLLVGIWWMLFAQLTFKNLPDGKANPAKSTSGLLTSGFKELHKVWQQLQQMTYLKRFLVAFFFYSAGVQTIMLVAAIFGRKELQLSAGKLIAVVLLMQLVAIPGAMLMSWLSRNVFGNVKVLTGVVFIWIIVCIAAYYVHTETQFYYLAAISGLIMGGIQSLSRSTYAKFLPQESPDHTSFFSFYDVTEKVALVIGMFSFGYIEEFTGSMRNSSIALAAFFVLGLLFLVLLGEVEPEKLETAII